MSQRSQRIPDVIKEVMGLYEQLKKAHGTFRRITPEHVKSSRDEYRNDWSNQNTDRVMKNREKPVEEQDLKLWELIRHLYGKTEEIFFLFDAVNTQYLEGIPTELSDYFYKTIRPRRKQLSELFKETEIVIESRPRRDTGDDTPDDIKNEPDEIKKLLKEVLHYYINNEGVFKETIDYDLIERLKKHTQRR